MKTRLLIALFAIFSITAGWSQKNHWSLINQDKAATIKDIKPAFEKVKGDIFQLDAASFKAVLRTAPDKLSGSEGVMVAIPSVGGKMEHFKVWEASNFAPELQAQFPEIRSYVGSGVEDPTAVVRLSSSPKRVQAMVLRADRQTEFIESYTPDAAFYILFNAEGKRAKGKLPFTCFTREDQSMERAAGNITQRNAMSSDLLYRKFRLALSCTGEYAQFHGGTVAAALAAMNETMTRVNGVYEKDLAVKLEIIANNTAVIYTSASSDPYSPASGINNWNNQLQTTLTNVIGEANYDIGHLFGASGGGGDAGCIGCICDNGKGSGITSPADNIPEGDSFDIDYVAHEMGHQIGGTHTYGVVNEFSGTNVEPGSGSTIMGYAGITGPTTDIQPHSDAYFVYKSIEQIQSNLSLKFCSVDVVLNNPVMTINAGPNKAIPKGTPFVLKAIGAEVNGANVTYNWDQNDNLTNATSGNNSTVYPTKASGPTFRSLPPTASSTRYMPALSSVLNNQLTTTWETVSTVTRSLKFVLTGRDNLPGGGQTKSDEVILTVANGAGPFKVTSQNTANITWTTGATKTITWDVAGTTANGVNTSSVNIRLSTDGGLTYPTLLAANTPNDGTETITVPNVAGTTCRVMVEAVNNIFYALNTTPFAVNYTVTTQCNTYTNNTVVAIPDNATNYSTSIINIPANATISDLNVSVNITHPYISDIYLILVSPNNTQVALFQGQCTTNDNLNVTFNDSGSPLVCATPVTGNVIPVGSLASFNGQNAQGEWILAYADGGAQDTGTLNSWSIEICSQQATAGVSEYGLQNFKLYPNPNSGSFTVEFDSDSANDVQIVVHDMRGRQIMSKTYENSGMFSGNINLGNVETGVYMVTVQDGNHKEVKRIVVQ